MTRRRLTLIRPPAVMSRWGVTEFLVPPIGVALLAGFLRQQGFPVTVIDAVGEDPFRITPLDSEVVAYGWTVESIVAAIPEDSAYIGVSCLFSSEWPLIRSLTNAVRERFPRAIIIIGGEHASAATEHALRDCPAIDYAVLGEGEATLSELLLTLENHEAPGGVKGIAYLADGAVVQPPRRDRIVDVDALPLPAWDLVPIEQYLDRHLSFGVSHRRTMPILATRGCPFRCTFCSSPTMWTQRWYARSAIAVVDEMELYVRRYGATNFDFYDLTAIIRKEWIVALCRELIRRDLGITWQLPAGTRSEAIDDEVCELLARAGHRNLVYAPESGSQRSLDIVLKKVHLPRMLESIQSAIRHGLSVRLTMVFGFPEDTPADILRSYALFARVAWMGIDDVTIGTFIPYPGSAILDDLRAKHAVRDLGDKFYRELLTLADIRHGVSYAQAISGRALLAYKLFGYFLFYSLSYLFAPSKALRSTLRVYRGEYRTRLEKMAVVLFGKAHRLFEASAPPITRGAKDTPMVDASDDHRKAERPATAPARAVLE